VIEKLSFDLYSTINTWVQIILNSLNTWYNTSYEVFLNADTGSGCKFIYLVGGGYFYEKIGCLNETDNFDYNPKHL